MSEQDYCQYIISKCISKNCSPATDGTFRTTKIFLESYENSQSFWGSTKARNRRLIKEITDTIDEQIWNLIDLEADAQRILVRCRNNIKEIRTHEDLFTVASDFLWVMASIKASEKTSIALLDDSSSERYFSIVWIKELAENIKDAEYDLNCMNEANQLPIRKRIFRGLICNPDVAYYANRENISCQELKQHMNDCQVYIKEKQQLYYAFMATVIYEENLRRRYR